jgi:hypothetical protein
MKRLFFIVVFALIAFAGCKTDEENNFCEITNNSSQAVTVIDERKVAQTIGIDETKSVERRGAWTVGNNFSTTLPGRAEFVEDSFTKGHFVDATPLNVRVANNLSSSVTLNADGYLDPDSISIEPTGINPDVYRIYTRTPNFTVTSTTSPATVLSATVEYRIEGTTMYVTIH